MTIIVCLDERGGMMFGGRRQSKDAALRDRILQHIGGSRLLMTAYSAKQFEENDPITIDDQYADNAADTDYCFVENGALPIDKADTMIIYRWHRHYPADRWLEHNPIEEGFAFIEKTDFVGNSHDCITEEIYRRK